LRHVAHPAHYVSCLSICLLKPKQQNLFFSQHATGEQVYQGEEPVVLPCQVNASNLMDSIVVWSRADLKLPVVHRFVYPGDDDLRDQNQRYRNRTSMRTDALQTGDLSLSLRKPNIFDSDNYTCSVIKSLNISSLNFLPQFINKHFLKLRQEFSPCKSGRPVFIVKCTWWM
uniref:Ig-like domain-containing protein n=1 Tax=Mastacembelus armatus TaxID=205130 RepID=A0A7N8XNC8_9TELE